MSATATQDPSAVLTLIKARRTCRVFKDSQVPRSVVDDMLEAARWAPNHRLTNPWRFFVLEKGRPARTRLGQLVWDWTYENVKNPTPERRTQSADQARQEVLDSPVLIFAYAVPGVNEEVTRENYAATCCAVQNMQLAAYSHGVAVGWSTGKVIKPEGLGSLLGADPSWQIVGAFFCGYPAIEPSQERRPVQDISKWL